MPTSTIRRVDDESDEPEQVASISRHYFPASGATPAAIRKWIKHPENNLRGLICRRKVLGYCSHVLHPRYVQLTEIAVLSTLQRHGHGRRLVKNLQDSLGKLRRRIIAVEVPSTNLPALLFFRTLGFVWVRTLYKGKPDEVYVLQYTRRES
jgi:ribosomal protein S18 acetylase RimI-like enzyme